METPSMRSNADVTIYFNCIKQEYDTRSLPKAIEEGRISEEDSDLIVRFISDRKVTKDIGIRRAQKITFGFVAW